MPEKTGKLMFTKTWLSSNMVDPATELEDCTAFPDDRTATLARFVEEV